MRAPLSSTTKAMYVCLLLLISMHANTFSAIHWHTCSDCSTPTQGTLQIALSTDRPCRLEWCYDLPAECLGSTKTRCVCLPHASPNAHWPIHTAACAGAPRHLRRQHRKCRRRAQHSSRVNMMTRRLWGRECASPAAGPWALRRSDSQGLRLHLSTKLRHHADGHDPLADSATRTLSLYVTGSALIVTRLA